EGTTDQGTTDEGTTDGAPTSCDSDKDCTAEGKICDPLTESCVNCLTDAECDEFQHCVLLNCQDYTACSNSLGCVDAMGPDKEAQPICDSDIGECSACLSAADCPESHDCTAKQCVPYQSCKNSTDCGADEVCDKSTGRCVNCLTNNDCSTNSLCEAGLCKAFTPCVSDKDCTSQGLLCDTNKTKCAQCLEHADCPAIYNCQAIGVDGTGVCVVDACAQGQGACADNAKVTCNATGDNYGSPEPCPAETTCLAPGGSPDCEAWVCTPNKATCTDNTAELCSGDGLSVASTTQCDNNSQKCIAGECIDTVCTPNESKCNQAGTAIETCKADGLGVVTQNCPEGSTICEDATCKAIICSVDTTFCDGTTVKQCNSTGTAAENFADCDPEKQACLGGACVNKSCTPGTAVCNGLSEVQTCNADGLGFATTDCGSGFACKDGECNKQVCTPNTILCVGTEIHQCGTLGLTASQVKDCAGQGKVCLNGVCTDQICTPDTSYCDGNKVMQCDATGISESIKQTCSSNQYCASGGSCKAQVCTPSSVFCDDQKLMACNANGSASETTQDCTTTGKFCTAGTCVDAPPLGSQDSPATSCKAILDNGTKQDGTYWLQPDPNLPSFQTFCDMTRDGGGWTLIAAVHRANSENVSEPNQWFINGQNTNPLVTNTDILDNTPSSFGVDKFSKRIASLAHHARFDLHAHLDWETRVSWFKVVDSQSFTEWFTSDSTKTLVCTDVNLTKNCSLGTISNKPGPSTLGGMNLSDYGYTAADDLHMRPDGDAVPKYSGVCSVTDDNDNNKWPDSAIDGGWGNGLRIWIREYDLTNEDT
ncbi:MAG TPA: hypothetical protein EYN66_14690, partial [Myxococcales bacterium]|nr:hypothetical protein [Myxococcales bacterium]